LERLRYQQARQADRPLGYRTYLQLHPNGRYAEACRQRLAGLALARARTSADLELILERYPDSQEARLARERLPGIEARRVLKSRDPAAAQGFLSRFVASDEAPRVRAHLAAMLFKKLPESQVDLESFIQRFGGTAPARKALEKLEQLLVDAVKRAPSADRLEHLRSRFPKSASIPRLAALVEQRRRDHALATLDLAGLEEASREHRWCQRNQKRCNALRLLARQAAPWRPAEETTILMRGCFDADMQVAWQALAQLAYDRDPRVGEHLVQLLGSPRLSVVWAAAAALDTWLGRLAPQSRLDWLARWSKKPLRAANPEEVQRSAYVSLLAGDGDGGRQPLLRLLKAPGRTLAASYLLARWEQRDGRAASTSSISRLVSAARARFVWLKEAFPEPLHGDSLVAAVLAERELFAIHAAVKEAGRVKHARGLQTSLEELLREIASILAVWRVRLSKTSASFRAARKVDLAPTVGKHEEGRAAALSRLERHRPLGHVVALAICRSNPHPACEGPRGAHRGGR
jgi:hypothetical protein